MKKILFILLLFVGRTAMAGGITYNIISAESSIDFSVHNFGIPVKGTLAPPTGFVVFDEKDLADSKFDVDVQVASINTKVALRDEHLRSDEFFDAAKYPTIHFTTTNIVRAGKGYIAYGKLAIKGKVKEVGLPFTFMPLGSRATLVGSLVINRSDFEIGKHWPPIGNDVTIFINVIASK